MHKSHASVYAVMSYLTKKLIVQTKGVSLFSIRFNVRLLLLSMMILFPAKHIPHH